MREILRLPLFDKAQQGQYALVGLELIDYENSTLKILALYGNI